MAIIDMMVGAYIGCLIAHLTVYVIKNDLKEWKGEQEDDQE